MKLFTSPMKNLLIICLLFCANSVFSQEYTDTIYYKSGLVRYGSIIKDTDAMIKYRYENDMGRVMTTSVRKGMVKDYTIGDQPGDMGESFTPTNLGYSDTLVYNTGMVRICMIEKETKITLKIQFINVDGKISKAIVRKDLLKSY